MNGLTLLVDVEDPSALRPNKAIRHRAVQRRRVFVRSGHRDHERVGRRRLRHTGIRHPHAERRAKLILIDIHNLQSSQEKRPIRLSNDLLNCF